MDIRNVTTEDITQMSKEEKREFVRALIQSEAVDVSAAIFDKSTNRTVGLGELVATLGEEKVIDMITDALDQGKSKAIGVGSDELQALAAKAAKGECSEEELKLLDFVEHQLGVSDQINFQQHYFGMALDLIHFAQSDVGYAVELGDILAPAVILTMIHCMKTENSPLCQYDGDPGTLSTMMDQIGKDIIDTWKASCTTVPSDELILCSLLQMAMNLSHEISNKMIDAEIIGAELGITLSPIEDEDNEEASENDNGSNATKVAQPIVHDATDKNQEMRNLLKD